MRYSVLLVDDEALELDALKNYVDWESMGMEVTGIARNGKAAWEKIMAGEPDVVITDIQMPVMDGITLANKIFSYNRRIRILFLTGYDEVEYLKAAIRVGAVDYILKPFSDEAVKEAMEKVKKEIEKDRLMEHSMKEGGSVLIRRLARGGETEEEREQWMEKLGQIRQLEQDTDFYGMMQIYGLSQVNMALSVENKLAEIVAVWQEERTMTVVIKGYVNIADAALRIQKLMEQLTDHTYNAAYYGNRISTAGLAEAFHVLESYGERMFYESADMIKMVTEPDVWSMGSLPELPDDLMQSVRKRLVSSIMSGNQKEIEDIMDQLFKSLTASRISRTGVLRCMDKLLYDVERVCMVEHKREWMQGLIQDTAHSVRCAMNMAGIREVITLCFGEMAVHNGSQTTDTTEYVVRKVKEYIHENYAGQITAGDLAASVHLTQNYIRSVFKEGTGRTVLEYLTEYRFEKACELLQTTNLKVKEISVQVGYENVPYFCTLFARRFGMSPNEYHKKYK